MSSLLLIVILAAPARAQFRSTLPSPSLPLIRAPLMAPAQTPGQAPLLPAAALLPAMSVTPRPILPAVAVPVAAVPASPPASESVERAVSISPEARAVQPAVAGRVDWPLVFDGASRVRANAAAPEAALQAAPAPRPWAAPEGRHDALVHAADRWRRLLAADLTAARAADLAGEVRNHLEVYLARPEPGLPGYERAAGDLRNLIAALDALDAPKARAVVARFKEDLVHRRSLRITVVLRQERAGGVVRQSDRFVLPGTTLRTLLSRVGGAAEKPEIRLDGGEWTPYGRLNPRRKLPDLTVVEVLLVPASGR